MTNEAVVQDIQIAYFYILHHRAIDCFYAQLFGKMFRTTFGRLHTYRHRRYLYKIPRVYYAGNKLAL